MFGFFKGKPKKCAYCDSSVEIRPVINVGNDVGHLCEKHLLSTYKDRLVNHSGKIILIPPTEPGKYISYQFETLELLKECGLSKMDMAPLSKIFDNMEENECWLMTSPYTVGDMFNFGALEKPVFEKLSPADGFERIKPALRRYISSNGVALPPIGRIDFCTYSLKS